MATIIPVQIDDDYVHEALGDEASRRGMTVPELITAIIQDWYDDLFLPEDAAAIQQAKQEAGEAIPWERVRQRLQRKRKVAS
jgi:hypothetical protein